MIEDDTPADSNSDHWHLDKRVPIALLVFMLGQFGMLVAGWTTLREHSDDHERRIVAFEAQRVAERLALVEAAVLSQRERDDRQDRATADSLALVRTDIGELKGLIMRSLGERK